MTGLRSLQELASLEALPENFRAENDTTFFEIFAFEENSTSTNNRTNSTGILDEELAETTDTAVLIGTLTTYGVAFLIIFATFCLLRKCCPKPFTVRQWVSEGEKRTPLAKQQYGYLSWVWNLFLIDDIKMMKECGMDSVCLVRICTMGFKLSLIGMLCGIFLMPIYFTAPSFEVESGDDGDDAIVAADNDPVAKLTTSRLGPGSPRLVATAVAAYLFFGCSMYLIFKELEDWYIPLRHKFLMLPGRDRNYAIFVRNVPPQYQSNAALSYFFSKCLNIYQSEDIRAHVGMTTSHLQAAVVEREETAVKLERSLAEEEDSGVAPTHTIDNTFAHIPVPGQGQKVNSIEYYANKLQKQNKDVAEQIQDVLSSANQSMPDETKQFMEVSIHGDQTDENSDETFYTEDVGLLTFAKRSIEYAKRGVHGGATEAASNVTGLTQTATSLVNSKEDGNAMSSGFVIFQKLADAQAALQLIHHEQPFTMEVLEAPDPEDIYWSNVGRHHEDPQIGKLTSFGTTTAACLLWTIPVSFVASLSSVEALRSEIAFIDSMLDVLPFLVPLFEVLAPQLLVILNALLPILLLKISAFEGLVSGSLLEASLFQKLAAFNIIQTFFVSALSGSVLKELSSLLDDPTSIVELLGKALPAQSTFFLQLALVQTVTTFAMEGLRIKPIIFAIIRKCVGPRLTEKERSQSFLIFRPLNAVKEFDMADYMSSLVFFFMILLVYSVIAPLVSFFLSGCFILLGALFRHQFTYIYPRFPDSGGAIWVKFIRILTKCLLIAEITIFGLLALKKSIYATPLMLPLIIITVIFQYYIGQEHWHTAARLPSQNCLRCDLRNERKRLDDIAGQYLQPELREERVVPEGVSSERLEALGLLGGVIEEEKTSFERTSTVSATRNSSSSSSSVSNDEASGEHSKLVADPRPPTFDSLPSSSSSNQK